MATVPRMTLSSCYWSLWESVHPVNAPSHLPGTSLDPEASLGLLAKVGSCAGVKSVLWFCHREGSWPFRMAVCAPSVTRPPHTRFSDAVCLVALFPLKLSSAACLPSRPPSPCVDLCMLQAFTSAHVQGSSLVMYPLRLTYSL